MVYWPIYGTSDKFRYNTGTSMQQAIRCRLLTLTTLIRVGADSMVSFRHTQVNNGDLHVWEGDPDDNAAHLAVLGWLQQAVTTGFLQTPTPLSNRVKGNSGEFIAHKVGDTYAFANGVLAFAANAWDPLSEISRPDLDIVWLYFGPSPADDWAVLQEVKTTGQSSLSLANNLIEDYDKLFAEDPRLTLRTRLDGLKNRLEHLQMGNLVPRLTALGGLGPSQSQGIKLMPTLVHDSAHDPISRMAVVRQALIARGWSAPSLYCWAIKLGDLDARLTRLSRGQP